MNAIEAYWEKFLKETGRPDQAYTYWHFELTEKLANQLAEFVVRGQKKATASSLYSFEYGDDPMPQVGDLSVITNWIGEPQCIIETTSIQVIPFQDITFELASLEGEDEHLESWREGHIRYYEKICKSLGKEFTWEMPVVFEQFKVIYM